MLPVVADEAELAQVGDDFLLSPLADGWRCLVTIDDRVRVRGRGGADLSARLPSIVAELARRCGRARAGATILDGNLVLPPAAENDAPGLGDVVALELLDVLCCDGRDVTGQPLRERQALLRRLVGGTGSGDDALVRWHAPWRGDARAAFAQLARAGAAGHAALLARRAESRYRPGRRSRDWLVFGTRELAEMLLCGVTATGALVLGAPTPHGLVFGGVAWPTRRWRELAARCTEADAPPFPEPPIWPSLGGVLWARPELWLALAPDVRDGSGRGGPRWRLVRVQEDLTPPVPGVAPASGVGASSANASGGRASGARASGAGASAASGQGGAR